MDGDAVEVRRPEVVVCLYGNGVLVALVELDGEHLPAHAFGIPCACAVAVALVEDGVANLHIVDEELGGACVARYIIYGKDVVAGVAGLDAVEAYRAAKSEVAHEAAS